jgi:three-Cys-motif partner protein
MSLHFGGLPIVSSVAKLRLMAKSEETVWEIEPHTLAKHAILRGYLQAWLPIMSKYNRRLVYVDGFAGPGVYKDGEPGSPIIALNAFLDHKQRDLIDAELVYIFIEEDEERANRLREELAKLGKLPDQVRTHVEHGTFEDTFSAALDSIDEKNANLAPTFAFIDPFGYAQAPMSLSGRFLQFDRCEVLIYVPLRFINRFLGMADQEPALNALFGTDEWNKARELEGRERLRLLHDLFYRQLKRECGLTYVRAFEIVTAQPNSGYTLFFGTKNKLGLEKMKESMWSIDPVEGQRYKDTTSLGMQPLFAQTVDTTPLRDALIEHFGTTPFTIEQADEFTLVDTPYIPSHVRKRTLKPLEEADKLEIVTAKDRRKRFTYPAGTKVRFKP